MHWAGPDDLALWIVGTQPVEAVAILSGDKDIGHALRLALSENGTVTAVVGLDALALPRIELDAGMVSRYLAPDR